MLLPLLFNLYSEKIIKEALAYESSEIKMNGIPINNIRFVDDTLVIADNLEEGPGRIWNQIIKLSEKMD